MEPEEIREQFEFMIETRERFLEKFRELGWEEFTKRRGATWDSMLGIFLHMLDVEEGWWQIATRGGSTAETPDRKPADYSTFARLVEDNASVGALTRSRLEQLSAADLERTVEFFWPQPARRKFEKIVMHAWIDELAHVGELVCLLWQLDVKPPILEWIDYREA
jgi:uncharacterized damage-inducible protein DinB